MLLPCLGLHIVAIRIPEPSLSKCNCLPVTLNLPFIAYASPQIWAVLMHLVFVWDSENSWKHCHHHFPSEGFLKLCITDVFEYLRCTLLLCHYSKAWHEHFMLLHFCCSKTKVHWQRMTLSLAMPAFASHVHGDWTDGPLLDTRIHERSEKSAVAGYCLHHPGHPHRREPAVQLVMFSLVLHVLIFMSGLKIRYSAYLVNSN